MGKESAWTKVGFLKLDYSSKDNTSSLIGKCLNLVLPAMYAFSYFCFIYYKQLKIEIDRII